VGYATVRGTWPQNLTCCFACPESTAQADAGTCQDGYVSVHMPGYDASANDTGSDVVSDAPSDGAGGADANVDAPADVGRQ
jgi:hypothetical protein